MEMVVPLARALLMPGEITPESEPCGKLNREVLKTWEGWE